MLTTVTRRKDPEGLVESQESAGPHGNVLGWPEGRRPEGPGEWLAEEAGQQMADLEVIGGGTVPEGSENPVAGSISRQKALRRISYRASISAGVMLDSGCSPLPTTWTRFAKVLERLIGVP